MNEFCENCGYQLQIEFKFCPDCGTEIPQKPVEDAPLESDNKYISDSNAETQYDFIECDLCGEENSISNKICSGCGAPLSGKKAVIDESLNSSNRKIKSDSEAGSSVKKVLKKTKSDLPRKDTSVNGEKKLETTKVLVVLISIVIMSVVLLAVSGVFSSKTLELTPVQHESSGVNLQALQHIKELEEKVRANPDDMETLLHLAHLKNDNSMYEESIQAYKLYLERHPDDADARIDMGVCYFNLADYETAQKEMLKALEYKPEHQIGHLNIGIVNLRKGNIEESKKWFQKAIDINPNSDIGRKAAELLHTH